ncbi:MAG: hypothetical protein KDJ30_03625 [Rhodoblastus sp.]|nr:hypothetical protein [Rhodoblastus sp.]
MKRTAISVALVAMGLLVNSAHPANALACGGFGVTDEVDSETFTSFVGTVDRVSVFGHGANSGQTIFWVRNSGDEKEFRLSVANEGTVAAMVTLLENSRQRGTKVEVCYCESNTSLPKAVSVAAGYKIKLCR